MTRLTRTLTSAFAVFVLGAFAASPAAAQFGLTGFSVTFNQKDGSPERTAGAHPYSVTTSFDVNTVEDPELAKQVPDGDVKSARFSFPPGFIGSIDAVDRCSTAEFLTVGDDTYPACPDTAAIGVAWTQVTNPGEPFTVPVYNLVPPPGVAAKIGFIAFPKIPVTVEIGVNGQEPNNVVANVVNVPQVVEFYGSSLEIWGIPANADHDPYRGRCLEITPVDNYGELVSNGICETNATEVPFLTMPRSCTGPLISSYEAISWQAPNAAPDQGSSSAPAMKDCSNLNFSPSVSAKPTTTSAESPSGLDFGIDIKDEGLTSPTGPATQSDVKDLVVRMPAGMTLNPSAANGLSVCPRANYEAESLSTGPGRGGCPEASKIGELEVETPILPAGEVLRGSVFLASQDDNPFGSLLALYVVIKDPELGLLIKRAGRVDPSEEQGPNAGRITTTFAGFPETPFAHLRFRFNQGARAPLVTPPTCGNYTTEAQFTPWANPGSLFTTPALFAITTGIAGGPCPPGGVPPFNPGFSAGSLNNNAGAYSPFNMRLTRADGQQDMTRFDAVLPRGVTGKLAGIAKCPDQAIAVAKAKSGRTELAVPSCPASSQIGNTLVGAGVGSVLTYVPGKLYLGGAVGAAPLSVISITPAVAGPFDVGTVVVREALTVDPESAEVKVDGALSDPIPSLLKGIPVKVRDLRVYTDRPEFTLNPTSCAVKEAKATLFGSFANPFTAADDAPVNLADRYQAASCASLAFAPKLDLRLKGGTKRGAHPALRATLTYPKGPGYANIKKAVVTLPHSAFLEQSHIRTVCTRVQFAAKSCPAGSIYGKARAFTPLLDEPLEGPVYLRSSSNPLPDLVVALKGTVDFNLVGRIDSVNASIRTTFASAPDAPVSKFVLEMQGGKKGLIVNSRNLCAKPSKADSKLTGHNGKAHNTRPVVKAKCGKKKGKGRG
jgi:hypothetical protein